MRKWRGRSVPALLLGFLLCLFYSVIFSGQVLGLLGLYNAWTAIPLALVVLAVSAHFYFWSLPAADEPASPFAKLDLFFGLCAAALTLALVALPLVLWPASPAGKTLTWDAGLFQFPKAVELFRSGSMWNMNVCYAEYPLGYESLLSFSMLLTDGTALFGTVHFALALFLIAALWLLAKRATNLPSGLLLLGIILILLSGFLNKDNNPWWIYEPLLFTVGKNDLFEGAAVLAVLAFAPLLVARDEKFTWNPVGFAMASMIAFSIKPNSLIILPLWLLAFYYLWKNQDQSADFADNADSTKKDFKNPRNLRHRARRVNLWTMVLMVAVALPGLLWVLRNLAALHTLFTQVSMKLTAWSIAANLTNPSLYKYIPVYLYFFLAVTGIAVILAVLRNRITLPAALTLAALLVGFAVTPASAFHGNTQDKAEIAWRFGVAFISYALLLLLVVVSPLLKRLIDWASRYRIALIVLAIGALAVSSFFGWRMRQLIRYVPENAIILRDQFEQPVGTSGYYSAYDYARKNIHNSSIIVDNGLPFYAYDAAYTDTTACSGHADYFIVFNTDWDKVKPGEYPDYVKTANWVKDWDVVYEDGFSRVYKRR
ncbi:MAG: hypothetical protein WA821_01820 [Anaerolineales bacterium]